MAKRDELLNPLADVVSEELGFLAEEWILREACNRNYDLIQGHILNVANSLGGRFSVLEMEKKAHEYLSAIQEYSRLLDDLQFNPTLKDVRIMTICAYANAGQDDFGEESDTINWWKPTFIYKGKELNLLKGFREFAKALFQLKKAYSAHSNILNKVDSSEVKKTKETFGNLIRWNFDVDNSSGQKDDKSNVFSDRKFELTDDRNFFKIFLRNMEFSEDGKDYKYNEFWNYVCSFMYSLYVRGSGNHLPRNLTGCFRIKTYSQKKYVSSMPSGPTESSSDSINKIQENDLAEGLQIKTVTKDAKEAVVVWRNRRCVYNNHTIRDVIIYFQIETPSGELEWSKLQAGYCENCNAYFVLENDFEEILKTGTPQFRVVTKEAYNANPQKALNPDWDQMESRLHKLGYNVNQQTGYSDSQRHAILVDIIENHDITLYEAKSTISYLIRRNENNSKFEVAIQKWKDDLAFLSTYVPKNTTTVKVDRFVQRIYKDK